MSNDNKVQMQLTAVKDYACILVQDTVNLNRNKHQVSLAQPEQIYTGSVMAVDQNAMGFITTESMSNGLCACFTIKDSVFKMDIGIPGHNMVIVPMTSILAFYRTIPVTTENE